MFDKKVTQTVLIPEILTVIGLDIVMSLYKLNQIKNYWSVDLFGSSTDFHKIMKYTKFQKISANLSLCDIDNDTDDNNSRVLEDILYFVRSLLKQTTAQKYRILNSFLFS